MSSAMAYIKLEEALKKPRCPLCHIVQEASRRYLDGLLYENVNDPGTRIILESSWGFCERHVKALANLTQYSLGIAIINEALLDKAIKLLKEATNPDFLSMYSGSFFRKNKKRTKVKTGAKLAALLKPTTSCPACEVEAQVTDIVLDELNYQLAICTRNCPAYVCRIYAAPYPREASLQGSGL